MPWDAATTPLAELVILSATALLIISGILWFVVRRLRDRSRSVRKVAAANGAHFSRLDADRIAGIGFPVFHIARSAQQRSVVRVYNVVTTTLQDGSWVRGFDFDMHREDVLVSHSARNRDAIARRGAAPGAETKDLGRKTRATRTAAYICLDVDLPPLVMGRKLAGWERVGEKVAARSQGEPFDVYSPNPPFARMFVNEALSNFLLEHKHLVLETYGSYVVVHGPPAKPSEFVERMRVAAHVRRLVSEDVFRLFAPKGESWAERYKADLLAGRAPHATVNAATRPGGAAPPK